MEPSPLPSSVAKQFIALPLPVRCLNQLSLSVHIFRCTRRLTSPSSRLHLCNITDIILYTFTSSLYSSDTLLGNPNPIGTCTTTIFHQCTPKKYYIFIIICGASWWQQQQLADPKGAQSQQVGLVRISHSQWSCQNMIIVYNQ